jgi:Domain of unknown function (DUF4261)
MYRFILIIVLFSNFCLVNQISSQNSNVTSNKQVVSGMVLKNDKAAFDAKTFLADLGTEWKLKTDSISQKAQTLVFSTGKITVSVSNMDYPLPPADIAAAAEISWLWKTAETDAARHKSYLLISVIGTPGQSVKLYKLFTTVAACALENTNSSGIYLQNQYLLLSKGYFTEAAKNMSDENLPVYLWVYFGILQENGQNSGYTYGLKEFGMQEFEIVNSGRSLQEVHACIVDATQLILKTNRRLQDGEEVTGGDGEVAQKIKVKLSNGTFLEGQTLKLAF